MAKIRTIQIYRGTKAQNDAYTGSVGELTMDTDNNDVRIHDGSTLGGHPIGYHPDLLDWKWADHQLNDIQWLRADTFSWQDGGVYEAAYQHLEDEYNALPIDHASSTFVYNGDTYFGFSAEDHLGDTHPFAYANIYSSPVNIVYADTPFIYGLSSIYNGSGSSATNLGTVTGTDALTYRVPLLETIAGIKIMYYVAADGHKIVLDGMESAVTAIYAATGVAWYYILDTVNQRFKLPRRHSQEIVCSVKNADGSWYRLYADGWVEQGGQGIASSSTTTVLLPIEMADTKYTATGGIIYSGTSTGTVGFQFVKNTTSIVIGARWNGAFNNGLAVDWQVSGQSAIDMSSFQGSEKHLYFYVGAFTQTAIENTAGLNSSLFNDKADIDLNNVPANIGSAAKAYFTQIGMPSTTYDTLTLGASGSSYQAPADGYFYMKVTTITSSPYTRMYSANSIGSFAGFYGTASGIHCFLPVKKGTSATVEYGGTGWSLYFVYAQGAA